MVKSNRETAILECKEVYVSSTNNSASAASKLYTAPRYLAPFVEEQNNRAEVLGIKARYDISTVDPKDFTNPLTGKLLPGY